MLSPLLVSFHRRLAFVPVAAAYLFLVRSMLRCLRLAFAAVLLFAFCVDAGPERSITVGMSQAQVLQRLHDAGATEVPKDVLPDAKGWSIPHTHDCLFLDFADDALSAITVEANADQPKKFRKHYQANSYDLP